MPYIVGLTGGIASGKSTVEKFFAQLGVSIIDTDIISRQVVEKGTPALNAIQQYVGDNVLTENGELNRSALRNIIFNDPSARKWLNQLLHPLILQKSQEMFAQTNSPYILWVVPLLIEENLHQYVDRVLVVDVDVATQLKRLIQRDNIDEMLAKNMLSSQLSNEVRLSYADDIIENNQSIETLKLKVNQLHDNYLKLSANHNK